MEHQIINQKSFTHKLKKIYQKPQIIQALALDARANTGQSMDPINEDAPIIIAPPGFSINSDEP